MRILLLVDCYLPSTKSSAKLVHDLARELVDQGHQASVVAPDPGAGPQPDVRLESGIEVVRVQAGPIKGAAWWRRGVNEARLSSRFWSQCRGYFSARQFDVIVFYSPTIFFGALVRRLKRLYGCPSYLILRDIFPQWAVDAGILRKGLAYWYLKRKEREQYDCADVIGVQSPANLDYFKGRDSGVHSRLEVLYNWTKIEPVRNPRVDYRGKWGLQGKTIFFYGGNIGIAQDCDNLIRLAARLKTEVPGSFMLFVGEGSEVPRLRSRIHESGLDNVSIQDSLPQDEYLDVVASIDVGLISLDRKLRTQNFPGKLLSYMHAGRPILASINPGNDLKELVEGAGAGYVALNGEDKSLFAFAQKLARDPELRTSMGKASRKLLEDRFSVSVAAAQILGATSAL